MKNQFLGKQQQYQHQISPPRNPNKKSIAQEYLKEKRPLHFDISSDSDEDDNSHQEVQMQRYGVKKAESSNSQSYRKNSRANQYGSKNQQIYELNMKIFTLENDFLAQKEKLIDKYEKQLSDANRQKSFLQQEKIKLMKQIDLLGKMNKNYEQEIQQLKQQLQIFIGQNRKTPNFNSMSKDFGQSELITILTHKDQKIKDLESKLKHLQIQKEQIQTSLTQSNRPDRSSGESFGGNINAYLMSFGEIQENLKKTQNSLKESNQIKETLTKQIQSLKNQLTQQQEHSNLLMEENSALENDRQGKIKEIQLLSQKLSKSQNKQFLLQKQLENLNKKLNINEDLLQIKEKQVQKLTEINQDQSQKILKMKKQSEKNQKQWASRLSKLENDKSMSISEKVQERKKEQSKFLGKIQSLVAENKKNLSTIEDLAVRQQRIKVELSKTEKQRDEVQKKLQQSLKQQTKIKHTCTIQEERILELQNSYNTLKNDKKSLKEEAEKIMRKQKSEITTLKQSLELIMEKSKKTEQQMKKQGEQSKIKEDSLNAMKSEIQVLNEKLIQEIDEKKKLITENEKLSITIQEYEELIIRLKQQNYELNKQIERMKQTMKERDRQSKQMVQIHQNNQKQQDIQKAYQTLQFQYRILETKFDKQTTQKDQMVQALNEKIRYYEDRINEDSLRYQEILNEKNYLFQQAQSLTYKCKEMYEYIHRMQQDQNKMRVEESQGENKEERQILQRKAFDSKNESQNSEQIQQLQRENTTLKQQIYRISQQMQELKSAYHAEFQRIQNYKSPPQSSRKPLKQITTPRKSSLESSSHEQNPLESVIQLLKTQKEHMLQTIEYQNNMIQQLQQEMKNAIVILHQQNEKSEEKQRQMIEKAHQTNIQILNEKLQEISQTIVEKQNQMIHMKQLNEKISEELKEMKKNHNEQLSRMQLELNLIKEDKKQLHEELDLAHEQLIMYEKERSKDKMIIINEIRAELEAKVSFINDDILKYKFEIKKQKEEMKRLEKHYQAEIQARQQLYLKQRQKLTQEIQTLNKDLNELQEKLKRANMIIAQEKHCQFENHSQNENIQMEFFEIKRLNQIYQQQIQSLNKKVQNLQLKNDKITQLLHQFDDRSNHIIAQMQTQISELFKENEHYRQFVEKQKQRINNLEHANAKISQELHKKSSLALQPQTLKESQTSQKQAILNFQNARTFPNHQDTFFMMENSKQKIEQKIFSQPIHIPRKGLNLYDAPQKDHVTFALELKQRPRQKLLSKSYNPNISFKPQNYSLTGYQTYQNPENESFNQKRFYAPLKKQKVEFYRI